MPLPSAARALGACGLASGALTLLAGCAHSLALLGVAGAVMLVGNVYAIARG